MPRALELVLVRIEVDDEIRFKSSGLRVNQLLATSSAPGHEGRVTAWQWSSRVDGIAGKRPSYLGLMLVNYQHSRDK